jgi:hypothetical protein
MHIGDIIGTLVGRQWAVLSAYFTILAVLQFHDRHYPLNITRVLRHAVWAASVVMTVRSLSQQLIPGEGHFFAETVHVAITLLLGALMYLLGCMFELRNEESVALRSES